MGARGRPDPLPTPSVDTYGSNGVGFTKEHSETHRALYGIVCDKINQVGRLHRDGVDRCGGGRTHLDGINFNCCTWRGGSFRVLQGVIHAIHAHLMLTPPRVFK